MTWALLCEPDWVVQFDAELRETKWRSDQEHIVDQARQSLERYRKLEGQRTSYGDIVEIHGHIQTQQSVITAAQKRLAKPPQFRTNEPGQLLNQMLHKVLVFNDRHLKGIKKQNFKQILILTEKAWFRNTKYYPFLVKALYALEKQPEDQLLAKVRRIAGKTACDEILAIREEAKQHKKAAPAGQPNFDKLFGREILPLTQVGNLILYTSWMAVKGIAPGIGELTIKQESTLIGISAALFGGFCFSLFSPMSRRGMGFLYSAASPFLCVLALTSCMGYIYDVGTGNVANYGDRFSLLTAATVFSSFARVSASSTQHVIEQSYSWLNSSSSP